jgi:hypothetical protein
MLGTRAIMAPGDWYTGIFAFTDGATGTFYVEVHADDDDGGLDICTEDRNFTYDPGFFPDAFMHRVLIGADGPPSMLSHYSWSGTPDIEGDVSVHYKLRTYGEYSALNAIAYDYMPSVEIVGKIALGAVNGTAFFRNIKAYELPAGGSLRGL